MKPLAYLRSRPLPVLALAMAYKRVLDRQARRPVTVTADPQLTLKLEIEKPCAD